MAKRLDLLFRLFRSVLLLTLVSPLFQACGGGGDAPPNANPTGYYTVITASVGDGAGGTMNLTDLQAIVHGNRFIAMSVSAGLIYDGTITSINENNFTANVTVYEDGLPISSSVGVNGQIIEGSSLSGSFNGTGMASGTFELSYEIATNNIEADISRISASMANPEWVSRVGGRIADAELGIVVESTGLLDNGTTEPLEGNLRGCDVSTAVGSLRSMTPISGTALYSVELDMDFCDPNTGAITAGMPSVNYTGLAVSQSAADDVLVIVFTHANNTYAFGGDFR